MYDIPQRRDTPPPHKRRQPPRKTSPKPRVVAPPRGDVASSGGDYGFREANAYKSTPRYKRDLARGKAAGQAKKIEDAARGKTFTVKTRGGGGSLIATSVAAEHLARDVSGKAAPYIAALAAPAIVGTAHALGAGHLVSKLATNAGRDLVDIPANAVPSLYHLLATGVHDPKAAAGMLAQPYIDLAKHPVKSFEDHPVGSALLFSGVKGGGGRGAGRAMRAVPGPSRRLASTARAPRTVEGTALREAREYSPDVTTKAVQVALERRRGSAAGRLDKKAAGATGERQAELQAKAAKKRGTPMSDNAIRRRVDERQDVSETLRREERGAAVGAARRAVPKSARKAGPTAVLVAQRIIKPNDADLRAYRTELVSQQASLSHAKLAASKTLVAHIDKALSKGVDWQAVSKAADDYRVATKANQGALTKAGILDPAQVERRTLLPYAVRNMGARHDGERVVAKDGSELSNDAIRQHMQANGVGEPSYVTQAPNRRGARNYFRSSHEPANAGNASFTGRATTQGTFDAHPDVLTEGAANAQALVSQQEHFGAFVKEFGHRDKAGDLKTYDSYRGAQQAANNMLHAADGSPRAESTRFRPVRIDPFAGRKEQLDQLVEDVNADHSTKSTVHAAMQEALEGSHGEGPWALVPEAAADRQVQHLKVIGGGGLGKTFQVASSAFRRTVLATSPRWLAGNLIEGGARAAIGRAGPRSYVTGSKVMKRLEQMDPAAARELQARALGGGHMAMADRQRLHRGAEQFENSRAAPVAKALATFWRTPGPKQVASVWNAWTDVVFNTVNGRAESGIQKAMLGSELRKSPLMDDATVKLGKAAVDQAARGLRDTSEQVAFARKVDDAYGRYGKMSPERRRAVTTVTPFLAWSASAVKFLTVVMPRDHPVLTSLVASANQATEAWRKEHGLVMFMDGAVPGFLQGSIPTPGGGKIRASRYLPTGIAGDLPGSFAGLLLPQVSGVQEALEGRDWKGAKLKGRGGGEPDDLDKLLAAGGAFLSSTVPLLAQAQRVRSKNSLGEGLKAEVNLFPVVQPKGESGGDSAALSSLDIPDAPAPDPDPVSRARSHVAQRRALLNDPRIQRARDAVAAARAGRP